LPRFVEIQFAHADAFVEFNTLFIENEKRRGTLTEKKHLALTGRYQV